MGFFSRKRAKVSRGISSVRRGSSSLSPGAWLDTLPFRTRWAIKGAVYLGALAAAGLGSLFLYYTIIFPDPLTLRPAESGAVIRILARDGELLAERGTANEYMPLALLPPHVIGAVVATEDRRFYDHWGIDPQGLLRAFFANIRAGRVAQGGSTLTQQLAKNLFLTSERTLARKMEELTLSLWLEMRLSKNEILELYLNRVYFGSGAYGIEAAAQRYFDKSARELTIAEAAVIGGLLKAPSRYSPASNPEGALARGRSVLSKMLDAGVIDAVQESRARREAIQFATNRSTRETASVGYAVDFVLDRLPALVGQDRPEIIVETTLDADLQKQVSAIVAKQLAKRGAALQASQAAMVVLDLDGGVRALVGGKSYAESQFNRAIKARRQPGSTFKPFVYLAALEAGYRPESIVYDLPVSIKGWAPRNDNGEYLGAVSLTRALASSINTVAARLILDLGVDRVAATAHRLGIQSDLREDASLALGTSEVSLLELTGAYDVFANGGAAIEPHIIRRVRTASGRVLFARVAPRTQKIIAPVYVGALNQMLNAVVVSGTGRRAALAQHQVAGKTGTSQDFRDAWFVGYTAYLTGGVWVGNDNGRVMNKVVGGSLPAEIWREVMTVAHRGKEPLPLPGFGGGERFNAIASGSRFRGIDNSAARREPQEILPWLARSASSKPELPPVPAVGMVPMSAPHPSEQIDKEFIEKALEDISGPPQKLLDISTSSSATTSARLPQPAAVMALGGEPRG
jgi:penicillin-binding protein 1A